MSLRCALVLSERAHLRIYVRWPCPSAASLCARYLSLWTDSIKILKCTKNGKQVRPDRFRLRNAFPILSCVCGVFFLLPMCDTFTPLHAAITDSRRLTPSSETEIKMTRQPHSSAAFFVSVGTVRLGARIHIYIIHVRECHASISAFRGPYFQVHLSIGIGQCGACS